MAEIPARPTPSVCQVEELNSKRSKDCGLLRAKTGWKMDLKSFRLVFAQGGRVRSRLISPRVWGGARGIPPSFFFF